MSEQKWFTIQWQQGSVVMLDQRRLPLEEVYESYSSVEQVAVAIEKMVIRGAPAIGIAAAMGVALAAHNASSIEECKQAVDLALVRLADTRPTAVNLFWALERMQQKAESLQAQPLAVIQEQLLVEANAILVEDARICETLGRAGAPLIPDGSRVLTHCNAGALATGGYGTALGVIRAAVDAGKSLSVLLLILSNTSCLSSGCIISCQSL